MDVAWTAGSTEQYATEPAVAGGRAYQGVGNRVIASNVATGVGVWSTTVDGNVWFAPMVTDQHVCAVTESGSVHVLSRESGEEQWSRGLDISPGAPVAAGGRLYVSGVNSSQNTGYVYAFNINTQELLWDYSWVVRGTGSWKSRPTVAVADDVVVVNNSTEKLYTSPGGLIALDPTSGDQQWQYETSDSAFTSIPVVNDGRVAFVDGTQVYVLSTATGSALFTGETGTAPQINHAPPVVTRQRVYAARGRNTMVAFDIESDEELWSLSGIFSPVVVGPELVYMVRSKNTNSGDEPVEVLAVGPEDGFTRYSYAIGNVSDYELEFALAEGTFFVITDGQAYAIRGPNSQDPTEQSSPVDTQKTTSGATSMPTSNSQSAIQSGEQPRRGFFTNGPNQPGSFLAGSGLTAVSTLITIVGIVLTVLDMLQGGEN